eukprot:scaffold309049_cov25-Prasinocladus_malaysianus.AAC.1
MRVPTGYIPLLSSKRSVWVRPSLKTFHACHVPGYQLTWTRNELKRPNANPSCLYWRVCKESCRVHRLMTATISKASQGALRSEPLALPLPPPLLPADALAARRVEGWGRW